MQSLESPHFHLLRGSKGKGKDDRSGVGDPLIKNETPFRLGMISLELELKTLSRGSVENGILLDADHRTHTSHWLVAF